MKKIEKVTTTKTRMVEVKGKTSKKTYYKCETCGFVHHYKEAITTCDICNVEICKSCGCHVETYSVHSIGACTNSDAYNSDFDETYEGLEVLEKYTCATCSSKISSLKPEIEKAFETLLETVKQLMSEEGLLK